VKKLEPVFTWVEFLGTVFLMCLVGVVTGAMLGRSQAEARVHREAVSLNLATFGAEEDFPHKLLFKWKEIEGKEDN